MFKKVILLLCVLSLMVWAAKPKAKTASAPKAKTTTKAVETKAADDEFDDSDFVSADKPESAATAAAVDADILPQRRPLPHERLMPFIGSCISGRR